MAPKFWATPAIDMPAAYYFETPYGLVGVSRYESADGWKTHAFPVDRVPSAAREVS
jgi:hypothetical protein